MRRGLGLSFESATCNQFALNCFTAKAWLGVAGRGMARLGMSWQGLGPKRSAGAERSASCLNFFFRCGNFYCQYARTSQETFSDFFKS